VQGGLKQVQLGPLLADAAISRKLTGVGTVNLDLTARGGDRQQLLHTLNGTVSMSLRDGLIKGLDLQKLILQAKQLEARYRGKEIPVAPQAGDEFRFTELNASARITDGVARNDDLSVKSPYFRIAGRGTADLPANRVDYQLDVTLVDTPKGQGGEELTALKGATIPVRVDGPLDQSRYRVALGALLQREVEKALLRELQKRLQK
jgi:AsmA protein